MRQRGREGEGGRGWKGERWMDRATGTGDRGTDSEMGSERGEGREGREKLGSQGV